MKIEFELLAKPVSIRFDLAPALVAGDPDVKYAQSRVVITDAHYYIFETGPSGFSELSESGALYDFERIGPGHVKITTEDMVTYEITKNPGCACGTTLKHSIQEFMGVPYDKF